MRIGGGVRIYLERPWFVTGSDESLGVILVSPELLHQSFPGTEENSWNFDPSNPLPQWCSQIGRDPMRATRGVTALTSSHFLNPGRVGAVAALRDAVDAGLQVPVTILGYVPRFEKSSGLWFADVQVNADVSYMPFLRLAVGRYQPNSLRDDVSLSRVSTIDIMQPLPNRTLTILRHLDDSRITVTLWGMTYLSHFVDSPDRAARVTVRLYMAEEVDADMWRPVTEVAEFDLVRDPVRGLWSATTSLPPAQPGQVLRLLVVERDRYAESFLGPGSHQVVYVGTIDL